MKQLITNPNATSRYDDLMSAILGQHVEYPEEAWNSLNQMTLSDQKPSALAHAMMAKLQGKCTDTACGHKEFLVCRMFENKLPTLARNGLVGVPLEMTIPTPYLTKAEMRPAAISSSLSGRYSSGSYQPSPATDLSECP